MFRRTSRFFVAAAGAAACLVSRANEAPAQAPAPAHAAHEAEAHGGAWPAMDRFHQALHRAWHPAAERGDLRPARAQAATLAARARAWSRTPAPASCAALPAGAVDSVAAGARAFASLAARRGDDARAMTALRALHDRFEAVERACTGHGDAEHAGHDPARRPGRR